MEVRRISKYHQHGQQQWNSNMGSTTLFVAPYAFQLFHVWSRMTLYKKAVREERVPPTFLPENGYTSLPEWEAWVANKGRHLELKRKVFHIGGQVRRMGSVQGVPTSKGYGMNRCCSLVCKTRLCFLRNCGYVSTPNLITSDERSVKLFQCQTSPFFIFHTTLELPNQGKRDKYMALLMSHL